jgi:glycine betaine/proline transport system substrate-binding protein
MQALVAPRALRERRATGTDSTSMGGPGRPPDAFCCNDMHSTLRSLFLVVALLATAPHDAAAAEDASCRSVRFADVGWSDIAAATAMASVVLEALGYKPSITVASIPVAFTGMKNQQIDVFLGYWKPSMTPVMEPFVRAGQIQVLDTPNLAGAKYTLAVPRYLHDKGLTQFSDIAKFRKELDGRIHGIESGTEANALIQGMIRDDRFGLKGFTLVESSEAAMLVAVQQAVRSKKAIVFVGWEPHPMNVQMKMNYLAGGDEVFGPNLGEARVYTAVSSGYLARCPNVAALLANLQFSPEMESRVMVPILEKIRPNIAARSYLKKNPDLIAPWLRGVQTFDGKDGLAAAMASLRK